MRIARMTPFICFLLLQHRNGFAWNASKTFKFNLRYKNILLNKNIMGSAIKVHNERVLCWTAEIYHGTKKHHNNSDKIIEGLFWGWQDEGESGWVKSCRNVMLECFQWAAGCEVITSMNLCSNEKLYDLFWRMCLRLWNWEGEERNWNQITVGDKAIFE